MSDRPGPVGHVTVVDRLTEPELAVLALLADLGPALDPSEQARGRMRSALLLERPVATPPAPAPEVRHPGRTDELAARRSGRGVRLRFLVASAAALCLVVALAAVSLLMSRDALPGDPLYGVKRAGETTRTDLTFGDSDRGLRALQTAGNRTDELTALLARGGDVAAGDTVSSLMRSFGADLESGSSLLTALGVDGDTAALGALTTWTGSQRTQLDAIDAELPAGAAGPVQAAAALVTQAQDRAQALQTRLGCDSITAGSTDALGPLPATGACTTTASSPSATDVTSTLDAPSAEVAAQPDGAEPDSADPDGTDRSRTTGTTSVPRAATPSSAASRSSRATSVPATAAAPVPTTSAPATAAPTTTLPSASVPVAPLPSIGLPLPSLTAITLLPGLPILNLGG